jgi:hypothetical protein
VRIAGREFTKGVADTDHGPTVELVMRHALAFDPAAISKSIAILTSKPLLAAQGGGLFGGWAHEALSPSANPENRPTYYLATPNR